MKQKNQLLQYLVLFAGLALIFAVFFLLLPFKKHDDVFWLNLTIACFTFIVTAFTQLGLFGISTDFKKRIAGLGIRLVYIHFYTLLAIAIIINGYLAQVNFRYQLFFQLLAIFVLLLGYLYSYISSSKAVAVQSEQDIQRKGKDEILTAICQLESFLTSNVVKFGAEKRKIDAIKETVRYLSPTNNQVAIDIDSEIAGTLQQACIAVKNNNGSTEVFTLLNKCEELLKFRKNTYSN